MSRIRAIKPGFFRDLGIARLPVGTRLTYIGMWTYVDDAGRGTDDARLLKAELWPLDDKYTLRLVAKDLDTLAARERICRYTDIAGNRLFHIVHWDHQKISHPQPSRLPPCPFTEHSVNEPGTEPERSSLMGREGKGREESPGFTDTPNHADNGQKRDRNLENLQTNGTNRPTNYQRLVAVCTGDHKATITTQALEVINWATLHVDPVIVDEAIGWLEARPLDKRPHLPSAAATVIAQKAADHGIVMPEFATIGKSVE